MKSLVMVRLVLSAVLGVIAFAAIDAQTAEACSPPSCWQGYFTPGEGATVPANLPAIVWRPVRNSTNAAPDAARVSLTTAAGVAVPLTGTVLASGDWVFTIDEPLLEGTSYVLRDLNTCVDQLGPTAAFRAVAPAPLPTALGSVAAQAHQLGQLEVGTRSGSCSVMVDADQVGVELALPAATVPWRDVLLYETLVDGRSWQPIRSLRQSLPAGESWSGRGTDRVYATCGIPDGDGFTGVAEGTHEVTMQATLAGTSLVLSADPLAVELACTPPKEACETPVAADGTCAPATAGCSAGGAGTSLGALGWLALVLVGRRGAGRRKRR